MEPMIMKEMTHVFFPYELFDEVNELYLDDGYIFGKVGNAMIGIKARYALEFIPFETSNEEGNRDDMLSRGSVKSVLNEKYDLVQRGSGDHYFVIELSSLSDETFEAFITRFKANEITFDETLDTLTYETILNGNTTLSILEARYDHSFKINGITLDLEYARYENPYVANGLIERKPSIITYALNGHQVTLDFNGLRRDITTS